MKRTRDAFDSLITMKNMTVAFLLGDDSDLPMLWKASIDHIAGYLDKKGIPYTRHEIHDGHQLRFPWCSGDIICHSRSYDNEVGNVESMNFPWDKGDVTVLTPLGAIKRITKYYREVKK